MDQQKLADKIAADLLKPDRPRNTNVVPCAACGRPTLIQNGDADGTFCHARCKDALEGGLVPRFAPPSFTYSMPMGKHGFIIACRNCRHEFDSKGLRCCSPECERAVRSKEKIAAEMEDADMESAPKRTCVCGNTIPRWRNGRRVHEDTKYCSRRCAQKGRRTEAI